jgi:hypothetical protein
MEDRMGLQSFTKIKTTRSTGSAADRRNRTKTNVDTSIENLAKHLPGEATAVYLAGLDAVGKNAPVANLIIIAVVALGIMLLIRYLYKSSPAVIITSTIAFVIWVYALGNGPFQALGLNLAQGMGAFLVIAYSTIITILADRGMLDNKKPA